MRAVTLTLAAIPVLFGGLGIALVAGGFDPFETRTPTIDEAPGSPRTASDPTSPVSDAGTPIDGRRPHLSVIDGQAPLELPISLPAMLSLLPPSGTGLAPLPPSAAPSPAPTPTPTHGDTDDGLEYDYGNGSGEHGDRAPAAPGTAAPDTADPRRHPHEGPAAHPLPIPGERSLPLSSLPLPSPDEPEEQPSASEPPPPRMTSAPRPQPDQLAMLAATKDEVRTLPTGDPTDSPAPTPSTAPVPVPVPVPVPGQDDHTEPQSRGEQDARTQTVTRATKAPGADNPGTTPQFQPVNHRTEDGPQSPESAPADGADTESAPGDGTAREDSTDPADRTDPR